MPDASPGQPRTVLAFDYGTKKIGVAIGNTLTRHARPLDILYPPTRQRRFELIRDLLDEWGPDLFIIDLPLDINRTDQYVTLQDRRFAKQLSWRLGVLVVMVDKRGSSIVPQAALAYNEP